MRFNDPSRPRSASGRPCWEGSMIVLPWLEFRPEEERGWSMRLMAGGIWKEKEIDPREVMTLLVCWDDSPEDFLRFQFETQSPRGLGSREVYGNEGYGEDDKRAEPSAKRSGKSAEELGF